MDDETKIGGSGKSFQATAWTQILRAQKGSEATLINVMDQLIHLYWKPAYFYIRRRGHNIEDAKDLTQQFFATFMERGALMVVDPNKGKFRTFLITALRNFLADDYDKRNALKRKPNIEFEEAHPQFLEVNNFERDWAMVVLDRAFEKLKSISPKEAKVVSAQRTGKTAYKALAIELETSESNIKVLAHRGKKKLREIILQELRQTVDQPGDEYDELKELFKALS